MALFGHQYDGRGVSVEKHDGGDVVKWTEGISRRLSPTRVSYDDDSV